MKKIFSFLLLGLLLSIGNAWGDQVTITPSDFTAATSANYSTTKSGVTAAVTSSTVTADEMRVFKNQTITISSSNTITGITFTCTANGTAKYGPGCFAPLDGYTYDASGPTGTWTGSSNSVTFTASTNQVRITSLVVTYSTGGTPTCATPDFSGETHFLESTTVAITTNTAGASIYYTTDGTDPTTSSTPYSTPFNLSVTATIKAIAVKDGYNNSAISEQVFTKETIKTVAQALTAIAALADNGTIEGQFVSGIISQVDGYNSTYHSITYWISDDGNTTSQLEVYSGKGLDGADFSAVTDLQVGDVVTVYGNLTKYVYNTTTTPEFKSGNKIVAFERPAAAPIINAENVELAYNATSGEIAYTISNPTEAALTAASSTPWISNIQVAADKVTFTTTANEGDIDREGFITLSYTGADDKVITITQAHYVIDYATLPFEWAGGASADLLDIVGVTASGLGSDYGNTNAPYLVKFDNTDDYIQVKTDSQPAKVTIGVKMIGGANASSISVQESADGTNFSEVQLLAISGNQNSTHTLATTNNFAATTRFVKMVFTKGSNVGVGPITITKATNDPTIELAQDVVNVDGEEHDGTIGVTYKNFTLADAEVVLCDAEGNSTSYTWLTAEINNENNIYYVISANTGAARTAYMKVEAMDDETNIITSDLIAVTQSACVYAVLPFEFDGGKADIETTFGLTQEGLGSDYGSSPKLKFDHTGDVLILRIKENAGVLSFDIKGNGFEGGTFSVQVSNDGSEYSNLDAITTLASTTANMAYSLAAGVRYIKWIYTEKSAGNVALGNIKVRKPAEASITLGTNGWSTYSLDYTCTLSGAEVYKAAYVEQQNAIVLTEVENAVVPAGEGIILKGTEGASVTITPSSSAASDFTGNELVGVLAPTEVEANWYVLATDLDHDGLTKFHACQAGIEIPANKAYMVIGEATAPSIRIIEAGNEATNIQNVEGAEKAVKFMENGKLYIQKNGVVYDAMGKTVR